jgi:hypothetical protein
MAISSMLADWRLALDPCRLAAAAGYPDLDRWQREVLQARPRRLLLNTARQTGKSLVASLLAVHQAIYEPGSLAVVAAVGQRQAMETIRVCRTVYGALGRPVPAESENKLSLELSNGSRILSIPSSEETVRGLSKVGLLILDEASRIPDAFYGAVLPFLATSNGALALLSTPWGKRGFYFEAYRQRAEWFYREVPASACTRIPATYLAEMRRKTSQAFYAQEFENAFNDSERGAFREEDVDAAVQEEDNAWNLTSYANSWNR